MIPDTEQCIQHNGERTILSVHGEPCPPLLLEFLSSDRKCIYDPVTDEVVTVDGEFYLALKSSLLASDTPREAWYQAKLPEVASNRLASLRAKGVLQAKRVQIEPAPTIEECERAFMSRWNAPRLFTIEVTEACNLRCTYCVYSGHAVLRRQHGKQTASSQFLREAVTWYLDNSDPEEERTIGFYGGEPLLCFNEIISAADFARSSCTNPDRLRFHITTNGVLLSVDRARELLARSFFISVSLNGDRETHDWARRDASGSGTFDLVMQNLDMLWQNFGEELTNKVSIICIMDSATRGHDYAGWLSLLRQRTYLRKLRKKFSGLSLPDCGRHSYKSREVAGDKELLRSLMAEYMRKALEAGEDETGFFKYLYEPYLSQLHHRPKLPLADLFRPCGACVPGRSRLFLSARGKFYPCEKVDLRFDIGSLSEGIDRTKVRAIVKDWNDLVRANCRGCWAIRFCSICYANLSNGSDLKVSMTKACRSTQMAWAEYLALYQYLTEQDAHAWDFLPRARQKGGQRFE